MESALYDGRHGGRVELGAVAVLEAPVGIHFLPVDEHARVEAQVAYGMFRILGIPVAHFKRPVWTRCLGHHAVSAPGLVVGVEIVCLFAFAVDYFGNVGRVEHVALSVGIQ